MSIITTQEELSEREIAITRTRVESREDRADRRYKAKLEQLKMLNDPNIKRMFTGHWTSQQTTKYFIFLSLYQNNFGKKSLRRSEKIFKQMSKFVQTRTADQCRSHHQKMQKKCFSLSKILQCFYQLRQKLTKQCLNLRKQISEHSDSGEQPIKKETKASVDLKNSYSNIKQGSVLNTSQQSLGDISQYVQNGYYVMPVFLVPCSEYYFYANSLNIPLYRENELNVNIYTHK